MIVRLEEVTREYPGGVRALDRLSLSVAEGGYVAVQGPSGSGKTTLLNLLAGLDRPSAGRLEVCGADLAGMDAGAMDVFRREQVGLVFQQFHLVPYLTAVENVMLAQYYHSITDEDEARRALEAVGLAERSGHLPAQMSGGEQQRVCVARALVNQPRLLLADEPTGSLDRANRELVLETFRELHRQGQTLIVVTHDPRVAAEAGVRLHLEHGRLAAPPEAGAPGSSSGEDELLRELWIVAEEGQPTVERLLARVGASAGEELERLLERGEVLADGARLALGPRATARARFLVRRHRLAQVMLVEELGLAADAVGSYAHGLEPGLDEERADRLCTRLGHPRSCPHGNPIPAGSCCHAC